SRLFTRDGTHTDALLDVEAAGLDDALLEAPALVALVLEIEVGVVDFARGERAEHALELARLEVERREQGRGGGGEAGGFEAQGTIFSYLWSLGTTVRASTLMRFTFGLDQVPVTAY